MPDKSKHPPSIIPYVEKVVCPICHRIEPAYFTKANGVNTYFPLAHNVQGCIELFIDDPDTGESVLLQILQPGDPCPGGNHQIDRGRISWLNQ